MRTALTTLGIAIGEGSADTIRQQMLSMGEDFVWISRASRNIGGVHTGAGGAPSLTPGDLVAIPANVPLVNECTPQVNGREQLIVGNQNWNTSYRGVTPAFFRIRAWQMARGSSFVMDDVDRVANVAVLGSSVATQLFGTANPVGLDVRVGRLTFKIVGVTAPKGQSVISSLLMMRHRIQDGDPPDFRLRDPQERLQVRAQNAETMKWLLSAASVAGFVFGYFLARRAAALDPIEALRVE